MRQTGWQLAPNSCQRYGGLKAPSLNHLRFILLSRMKKPPKIRILPPTYEAAIQHVRRARLQALIRKIQTPKAWHLCFWLETWIRKFMSRVWHNSGAPSSILQIVARSCKSQPPCSKTRCSCRSARLSCTTYCSCSVDEMCSKEGFKDFKDSISATSDEDDDE